MTRPQPFATVLAKGARPALHAETASRGSEPVASPTGREEIHAHQAKGAQGAHAFQGGQGIETPSIETFGAEGSAAGQVPARDKAPARAAVAARVRVLPPKPPEPKEAPAPAPPPRRPAFYEALAVYETGVRALQRHDFEAAASSLRSVIQGYPGERELVERARLYLQVCERETARRPSGPQTASESVYAATVALNAGDVEGALRHLGKALEQGAGERSRPLYYGCCPS